MPGALAALGGWGLGACDGYRQGKRQGVRYALLALRAKLGIDERPPT